LRSIEMKRRTFAAPAAAGLPLLGRPVAWDDADFAVLRSNGGPAVLADSKQERTVDTRITTEALTALAAATRAAAVAAERALSVAEVLDETLARLSQPGGNEPVGVGLSGREQEVLALVAKGYSNKAIAEALFISPNTVKTHVASLLTKLRVDSRVQLATVATRQDLHRRVVSHVPINPVPMTEAQSRR
jgi:DNA-binding CsgD family transcriptional regulator